MKTIGLIGGMSWESTLPYYQYINEEVRQRLGGLHSAKVILYSVDFHEIEQLQRQGNWEQAGQLVASAAVSLQKAGADMLILCTNTMHKVASDIEAAVSIPLLHIADATGKAVRDSGLGRVGLLGTRFTMEQNFYRKRLEELFGIEVLIPSEKDRHIVHKVIYEELCQGRILDSSRSSYMRIIGDFVARGAEGVILGCTEIGLLIEPGHVGVKTFDTTVIHAKAAVAASFIDVLVPVKTMSEAPLPADDFLDTEQL